MHAGSLSRTVRRWRDHHRRGLLAAAGLVVVLGLAWAALSLNLTWSSLRLAPLLTNLLLASPLMLVMNALGLQLSAMILDRHIGFRTAVSTTAAGTVAELLPIPGGMIARGAALVASGASTRDSGIVLGAGSLLWLGLAAIGAGVSTVGSHRRLGVLFLATGLLAAFAAVAWIASRSNWQSAALMLAHRCLMLALLVTRIWLAFATLGVTLAPHDASVFSVAAIVGSSVSIVPAGLGVTEGLAAVLAPLVTVASAAAFAAMTLNRGIGLAVAGIVGLAYARGLVSVGGFRLRQHRG